VFNAHAFDAANLVFDCIEDVAFTEEDGTTYLGRQALRDCLYSTAEYEGLTGNLTCTPFEDCGSNRFRIYELSEGEYVPIRP
jgi:branched-chain amino acid transport system substrate-binding protein